MRRFAPTWLFLILAAPAFAQAPRYEAVDAIARDAIERQELVGLAVVVIDGGKIAWTRGYGFEDLERGVAVDPAATQYRWASISKPVTAIAALQLAEQGKLDLDADVREYVPEFPDKGVTITSRQLLGHQGGIVHYSNGPVVVTKRDYDVPHPFADVVTALDTFKESPLVNPPGEKYSYTTHGFMLLAAVVERAGKQRFADQVRQRIAGPLGMASFRPDYQWEEIPRRAVGYRKQDRVISRRPADQDHDVSWKLGGGGFTSTAEDLARFGVGLLNHKVVAAETERQMWTPGKPADPAGAKPYGLGFFVGKTPAGVRVVGHDGSQEKARTALFFDPETGRGVALMTSSEWADVVKPALALIDAIR